MVTRPYNNISTSGRFLYLQSPVGNCVPAARLRAGQGAAMQGLTGIDGWTAGWYGSGTMALAAAVSAARARCGVERPKVALAAYGCPDLVSAILFAGAEPLFIDLVDGGLGMDTAQLGRHALDQNDLCAIIGTDLFGISEDWATLRDLAERHGLLLIQDSAQSFQRRENYTENMYGDVVVHSFGRGKPICMLAGGALLVSSHNDSSFTDALLKFDENADVSQTRTSRLKIAAYNALVRPRPYSIVAAVMGDKLGQTVFKPLMSVEKLSDIDIRRINVAVEHYWRQHVDAYSGVAQVVADLARRANGQMQAVTPCEPAEYRERVFSRFVLMAKSPQLRDDLILELRRRGITATPMYARTLPEICGSPWADTGRYPIATVVARQLMTLPVHDRITETDIAAMNDSLRTGTAACASKS
jgi:dTDP-4-amino-4,6-dideoxygalactose transaminase